VYDGRESVYVCGLEQKVLSITMGRKRTRI
jgi:hypothetical protein